MKPFICFLLIVFSGAIQASTYFGLNGGYSFFSSDATSEYKINPKGPTFGGFIGVGKDFVGLEAFYQSLKTTSDIRHEGEKGEVIYGAQGYGAALRFSFQTFYLRLGLGRYTLKDEIKLETDTNIEPARDVYNINDGVSKMGVLYGVGIHHKFAIGRFFIDYTRHQITSVGAYNSVSAGFSWVLGDNFFDKIFSLGKSD